MSAVFQSVAYFTAMKVLSIGSGFAVLGKLACYLPVSLLLVVGCPSTYKSGQHAFCMAMSALYGSQPVMLCFIPLPQVQPYFFCRIRSFLRPANAGLTAAEALTAPFFTYDQDRGFFLDA